MPPSKGFKSSAKEPSQAPKLPRSVHLDGLKPTQADGLRLQKRYWNLHEHLFLFLEDTTIPPTNNASEQALRMSVVFRKVTHGFRSDWGAELFANIRSIINTGKRHGLSALQAITKDFNPLQSFLALD